MIDSGKIVPRYLYKYCPPERRDILDNLKIKVTPPCDFNDPFEMLPKRFDDGGRRLVKGFVKSKEAIREAYISLMAEGRIEGSFKDFKRKARSESKNFVSKLLEIDEEESLNQGVSMVEGVSRMIGFVCLSEISDSILMWSHYAYEHQGFVIRIDSSMVSEIGKVDLHKVLYENERVTYRTFDSSGSSGTNESIKELIRTKSLDWAYEQEWRILMSLKDTNEEVIDGKRMHFGQLPTGFIDGVIGGCRISPSVENQIRSSAKRLGVKYVKCELAKSEFKLVVPRL